MLLITITTITVIAIYVYIFAKFLQKAAIKSIVFDNEDDAFATILSQIFKSKSENELRKMIDYILAYDDQFNNEKDLDYFIDIWDKRMKALKPTN